MPPMEIARSELTAEDIGVRLRAVLRVLDKSNLSASIDKLGLDPDTFQQFKSAVSAPHGRD